MGRPSRFSSEVRERAIRLVMEQRPAHPPEWAALQAVATKLGTTAETLRKWVRQAERDTGQRPRAAGARESRAEVDERDSQDDVRVFAQAALDRRSK
jgi:transposase